ncbi:kinase-like domain-containing protein [Lasiosphaeris hirsuta]|uniref:Kinase-like domain-containing protein n=1 Tax=Lasiosphaeris hirsuta TaxID=260670 RepID=A0AA40A7P3_9PEZI|nr:kinase-like domain-containing protein [Lasiosphaeris hirsuta]
MTPKISDTSDLARLIEEFEYQDGAPQLIRTVWVAFDDDDNAFFGQKKVRKYDISLEQFEQGFEPIPDDWAFPEYSEDLTVAPNDGIVSDGLYLKRPNISLFDPDDVDKYLPTTPRLCREEAVIMETLLLRNPHPNIVRYHGCRVRRNRVTGLLLDAYSTDLNALESDKALLESIDRTAFVAGIESAIAHLHSLGLAHNDLNPANIMLGKSGEPILIDFDSCRPFGERLLSGGTRGWIDEKLKTSEKENDLAAIPKIVKWLEDLSQGVKKEREPYPPR